jgi:YHS domain-containing protein
LQLLKKLIASDMPVISILAIDPITVLHSVFYLSLIIPQSRLCNIICVGDRMNTKPNRVANIDELDCVGTMIARFNSDIRNQTLYIIGGNLMENVNKDPVCGMQVDRSGLISSHEGQTYHFCSVDCKQKFEKNPELYINKNMAATGKA